MDKLFDDLNQVTNKNTFESVHLSQWPKVNLEAINADLEAQMRLAQDITSMVFSIRKKENIRVRQPLQKIMVPAINETIKNKIEAVKFLVLSEVNVKELEFMNPNSSVLVKKIKPNFKTLGPKFGGKMKDISQAISKLSSKEINTIEKENSYTIKLADSEIQINYNDVIIETEDIPGWSVASMNGITIALDISLSDNLINEGLARELVNRVQNLRKDLGFKVTDQIDIKLCAEEKLVKAINNNLNYICSETLAENIQITPFNITNKGEEIELADGVNTKIELFKR